MEWTKEKRYRKLDEISQESYLNLVEQVKSGPWRQRYHIQPNTGLLNDPNGLAYYEGWYHLFYQWFPLGPVHGIKYWYHLRSKDLVNWEDLGIGLAPDHIYDSHGVYSGSSFINGEELYLFFTGNHRDEGWKRYSTQCLAKMDKNGTIVKNEAPIIAKPPAGITEHFRDPKVFQEKNLFYMIVGAQKDSKEGTALIYQSKDLEQWSYQGELYLPWNSSAYMWECPDYFQLGEYGVLLLCPQGIETEDPFQSNIYESGYLISDPIDLSELTFGGDTFIKLDYGFDFYAPQTFKAPKDRRILFGWLGVPEVEYPTDTYDWAHCMTVPRELTVTDGRIRQNPVRELELLRKDSVVRRITIENQTVKDLQLSGTCYEMLIEIHSLNAESFELQIRKSKKEKTILIYNKKDRCFRINRRDSGKQFATEYGFERYAYLNEELNQIRIFSDESSLEVFLNQGEICFSLRIFPEDRSKDTEIIVREGMVDATIEKWNLA
ncbi:sucrose-6-phosphate hydrolase [Clostridium sp. E02]|uniref:glycoside hydrolase family 32 protein n=1 Tax=Clostridium sp. E02 TaxID=2487134 RepID=UPI000F54751E|nr:sucrose-6-phosphate hydrolase [Clostridium sp. E02]